MPNHESITKLLNELKIHLTPTTDLSWSKYNNIDAVINEINDLISSLEKNDKQTYKKINFFIAPTNDIQEISITNGWGEEFNKISEKIEIESYKKHSKLKIVQIFLAFISAFFVSIFWALFSLLSGFIFMIGEPLERLKIIDLVKEPGSGSFDGASILSAIFYILLCSIISMSTYKKLKVFSISVLIFSVLLSIIVASIVSSLIWH